MASQPIPIVIPKLSHHSRLLSNPQLPSCRFHETTPTTPPPRPSLIDSSLPRLPMTHLTPDAPPALGAFLNSNVVHVPFASLPVEQRTCVLCLRPMCDYWALKRTQRKYPSRQRARRENNLATKKWAKQDDTLNPFALRSSVRLPHTCQSQNRNSCEVALQIQLPGGGCGHVVGHACLERWLLMGWPSCPVCGVGWYVFHPSYHHTTVVESYDWCTGHVLLKEGDECSLERRYKGGMGRIGDVKEWSTLRGGRGVRPVQGQVEERGQQQEEEEEEEEEEDDGGLECGAEWVTV